MRSLDEDLGESRILVIAVTHESGAKGEAERGDRLHRQGKECRDPPPAVPDCV